MKMLPAGVIAVVYLAIITVTIGRSRAGWAGGHPDSGLWWGVISGLLTIAVLGLLIGTWRTLRAAERD